MTRARLLLACALLAGGCATPRFRAVDADPGAPVDVAAAWYDLAVEGRDLGDVKVWSRGAPASPLPDVRVARQLAVGLRIRNDGDGLLRLDRAATELELQLASGRAVVLREPRRVDGQLSVPPGAVERLELLFVLPASVDLHDLSGYELCWTIVAGERRVSRVTAFRRADDLPEVHVYPYTRFYFGPYHLRPMRPGWGVWLEGRLGEP